MVDLPEALLRKAEYLRKLSGRFSAALDLHQAAGRLWEKDAKGESWSNVTEHCLLEALRVKVFAELLGLPDSLKESLVLAAVLHDFYKRLEIRAIEADIQAGGSGRAGVLQATAEADRIMRAAGFSEEVIRLADSVGGQPEVLLEIKKISDKAELSDTDLAALVMHYVDGYTIGSLWVMPAGEENGSRQNDLDRRVKHSAANSKYVKMDEESRQFYASKPFFQGKSSLEAAAEIGHLLEGKLAEIIQRKTGRKIEPWRLPEVVDQMVRTETGL